MNEFQRRKWFHNGYGGSLQSGRDPVSTPACSCKGWASHQSQVVWLASQGFRLHKNGKVSEQGGGEGRRDGGQKGGLRVHLLQGHEVFILPTLCSLVVFWDMKNLRQEHLANDPFLDWTLLLSPISSQRDMSQQMLCAFDANSTGITARWIIFLPKFSSHLTGSKVTLNYVFRDLMLTTPRKSDGSKSLTWIFKSKAVKLNKLWKHYHNTFLV